MTQWGWLVVTLCEIAIVYLLGVFCVIYANTTAEQRMKGEPHPEIDRILRLALLWPFYVRRRKG